MKNDKLINAQMKEISRLQVLASKQVAEIHAKEMLIRSLVRGKKKQEAEIAKKAENNVEIMVEIAQLKTIISDKDYTIKTASDVIENRNKQIAQLKELLKEAEKWVCEKCAVCDHIRCERYEWLTKQKLWSGSQKPSKR